MTDISLYGLNTPQIWDIQLAFERLASQGQANTKRTAERRIGEICLLGPALSKDNLLDEFDQKPNRLLLDAFIDDARNKRQLVLFIELSKLPDQKPCLFANDARGARYWIPLLSSDKKTITEAIKQLQNHLDKPIALFPHGQLLGILRTEKSTQNIRVISNIFRPVLDLQSQKQKHAYGQLSPHLKQLESESIHILREAVAESENPVMLYSIGKDSAVMLHLAKKAFYPSPLPFPILHVDTRWKFQEMYLMRDRIAKEAGIELITHINPEAIEKNINPFDHGSAIHTDITKTEGLKQAINHHAYDVIFGGARRDEEKSRAKERIFSFRDKNHRWDPKNQRPELWSLFNTKIDSGQSIRVFPLSNWTELDIWQYILHEGIPVVPLYFAKERPVVVRNNMIILVDDDRFQLLPDEKIVEKMVRFRTLGCYPLTGAVESSASNVQEIILELAQASTSERQGRAIDLDSSASMEKKKQEGYF